MKENTVFDRILSYKVFFFQLYILDRFVHDKFSH